MKLIIIIIQIWKGITEIATIIIIWIKIDLTIINIKDFHLKIIQNKK